MLWLYNLFSSLGCVVYIAYTHSKIVMYTHILTYYYRPTCDICVSAWHGFSIYYLVYLQIQDTLYNKFNYWVV